MAREEGETPVSLKGIWNRLAEIAEECDKRTNEYFPGGFVSRYFDGHLFAQRLKEEAEKFEV